MQSNQLIHPSYFDKELEEKLDSVRKGKQELYAILGKHHGTDYKPASMKHYEIEILFPLKNSLQELVDRSYSKHLPISLTAITNKTRTDIQEELSLLSLKLKNAEIRIAQLREEQEGLHLSGYRIFQMYMENFVPVVLGGFESILMFTQLEIVVMPFLLRILLSIVAGLVASLSLKFAARHILKAPDEKEKNRRHLLVAIVVLIVTMIMGVWRYTMYASANAINAKIQLNQAEVNQAGISAMLPFILFSFGAFMIALSIKLQSKVSKDAHQKIEKYQNLEKQVIELQDKMKTFIIDKKNLLQKLDTISADAIKRTEYAASFEKRLVSLANELQHFYESVNLTNRRTDECPEFFGKLTSWNFNLHFKNAFKNQL